MLATNIKMLVMTNQSLAANTKILVANIKILVTHRKSSIAAAAAVVSQEPAHPQNDVVIIIPAGETICMHNMHVVMHAMHAHIMHVCMQPMHVCIAMNLLYCGVWTRC